MPNEFVARNGIIALNSSIITGSLNVSSGITGSLFGTASWATNAVTSSYILNAVSASFAGTASFVNPLRQDVLITGSLNVTGSITTTGTITAQTLVVQTITSSTDFVTGSTRFGSLLANTHQFTGSVSMTGSLTTNGNTIVSGSLTVATSSNQGGVQLYSNSSVGGGIRFSHTNGSVIGRIELNAGGGTNGLDLYAYDYFNFKTLNTAINFITTTTANWYTYGGNKFNFVGYTGFGGEVIMKNNLDGTEVFHAYLADTYKVAFPTGSVSIGKPAATTPNATLDVSGSVTITGSLTVFTGSLIEFQVTSTGTKIGNAITDAHTVTGSLNISGSVTATNFTGSLFGTSSWAVSASWAPSSGGSLSGGSANYIPLWTSTSAQSTSSMYQSSGNIGINTTSPSNLFEVNGISAVVNSFGAFTALQASGSTGYRWTLANDASFRLQYTTNGFAGLAGTPMYINSSGNVGIGTTSPSLKLDVSGSDAIFNGVRVGRGVGNISTNTMLGGATLYSNTTGANNIAIGYGASGLNTTGNQNTAVGTFALYTNTTGYAHTAIGYQALTNNTTGYNNTAVGYQTLISNTTGYNNTALGYQTLYNNTSAGGNVAIGHQALFSNTGSSNTAVGFTAGFNNRNIGSNTFIGSEAGYSNTTGGGNTIIGSGNYYLPSVIPFVSASNKISIAASGLPEIWSDTYSPEVSTNSSASVLYINSEIYKGAVIDYAVESSDITSQRTGTIWLNFDYSGNITMNEQVTADIGDTTYYVFSATFSSPYINLILTNNSGTYTCVAGISCRLFKRYFAP